MSNVINEPTRQQALLDPIIIPDDLPFLDCGTITVPANISDHKGTYITLLFQYDTEGIFNRGLHCLPVSFYGTPGINGLRAIVLF